MVSGSISLRCSRFFSPFPHGTGSLSVSHECLALPDGAGWFLQGVSDPAVLRILLKYVCLCLRDYHPLWCCFPEASALLAYLRCSPTTPKRPWPFWFGLFPFRSPLLRESLFVFFSSRYLDVSVLWVSFLITQDCITSWYRVAPFGYLRINGYFHLPEAFRR